MFPQATAKTSLAKLKDEIHEVERKYDSPAVDTEELLEEYADCFMCLLHSMSQIDLRTGRTLKNFARIFAAKAETNYKRQWKYNGDGTYSHVKP